VVRYSLIVAVLLGIAASGCTSTPPARIENIGCRYMFSGLDNKSERARVEGLIRKYAKPGSLLVSADQVSTAPVYTFVVDRLAMLTELHAELVYGQSSGRSRPDDQLLNPRSPVFHIHYDSAHLGAALEVIVHFRVTPGAQLFYKPQAEQEQEITSKITASGDVTLRTSIEKGHDYIYARSVSGNVNKYIRINVYSQEVREISKSEYP
jgi:hypothetical protein